VRIEFLSAGDPIEGALYAPEGPGPHPGVVIIPDVWGLYDHYHEVAKKVAANGFVALAINLYSREGSPDLPDMDAVFRFMKELPDRRVLQDIQAGVDALSAREEVGGRPVGIMGFCMGGKYTILAACTCQGLSAAVPWYGLLRVPEIDEQNPEHPLDALPRLTCPMLGLFGKEDSVVPLADVEEVERRTASSPHPVDVIVYPGAGHAFANDTRPQMYREDAARDGWSRAFTFLNNHLD
jgi:carboxymethylenebutenolidase